MSQDSSKEDAITAEEYIKRSEKTPQASDLFLFSKQIASYTSSSEKATEDRWEADKEDWMDESKESRDADECVFKVYNIQFRTKQVSYVTRTTDTINNRSFMWF